MSLRAPLHAEPVSGAVARRVAVFLAFLSGYFLLGMAGLQLQSAQTGVTPVWPASGFAFAMVYWFGVAQVAAIVPAMLALGWLVGVPAEVAAISAAGSMLEVALPVLLMRHFSVDPGLRHLRDALLFVAIGPVLGPMLSATAGGIAFAVAGGEVIDPLRLWLLWWLGNSVGILLVGGFGLVMVARRSLRVGRKTALVLLPAGVAVLVITVAGISQITHVTSPLMLYLLIPVFVLAAQHGDPLPVLALGVLVMIVLLASAAWLPAESLAQTDLGILCLDISLLWVVVFTGMVVSSARREMQAREQVSWLANHDVLTRLLNRHVFMERLENALSRRAGDDGSYVLVYLDLDHFKALNDAEGHRAGDQVLRDISAILSQEVRKADTLARLGGDEFGVLLEDCQLLDGCSIAENIRSRIERYEYVGARGIYRVEASIGLVRLESRHGTPEEALHDADSACYDAKRAGRNRVLVCAGATPVTEG